MSPFLFIFVSLILIRIFMKSELFVIIASIISIVLVVPVIMPIGSALLVELDSDSVFSNILISAAFAAMLLITYAIGCYYKLFYKHKIDSNYNRQILYAKNTYQCKSETELRDLIWENSRAFDIYPPSGAPCYDRRRELKDSIVYYCELELERRKFVNASRWMIAYFVIAAFSLGYLLGK